MSKSLLRHHDEVNQIAINDFPLKRSFKIVYHKDKFLSTGLRKLIAGIENKFHSNTW
ncbi:hypothetical protein [[Clostridium] symbiosum]|uniref:hypothetical protein n=1 Tax=Clostridium symbiosum TaxID=1512 RepID=UPI001FC8AA08|nr:hypothetical protein [[Clostridium] symbiosum]